ncbi:MAG: lipocalin family protein [FCB group bacterium]|jgi:apolipoprotein D and lipocalin family protein
MKKIISIISSLCAILFGCSSDYQYLPVVKEVDLNKYLGKWYEIASFPQSFQKDCNCTTAEYFATESDYIKVVNSCRKKSPQGELATATGKAFIVPNTNNAKLKVQFFWPFKGDYWIIELAEDYSYAVVGHPNRDYLWILSRSPKMEEHTYQMLLDKIKQKGFDITRLNKTVQICY